MSFRFAIMGAGNIAVKFCHAVSLLKDCEIVAVASKSLERAERFAGNCQIKHYYDSYEKMLQEIKPDCVYIATTPDSHYSLAKLCMEYKTPVLCEKAMFMNSKDAKDIFTDAKNNGIFVMEAMWSRFLPAVNKAKKWMTDGLIGKVNCLTMSCGTSFDREKNQRNFNPKLGGGAAFDLTVYNYELATWFLGEDILDIQVSVMWDENGIDTFNHVLLKYRDKLAVLLSSCDTLLEEALVVMGNDGKIVIPHAHYADGAFLYDKSGVEKFHFVDKQTENGFVYEIREVMNCIKEGKVQSEVVPHEITMKCAKLFDEIYRR